MIVVCFLHKVSLGFSYQSRWLRARKFDIHETIKMVEEATDCTSIPRKNNFYPSPSKALGCDTAFYMKQYPQVYYGHAKNGCPIFYSKPALMDINSVESLTSLKNIINYHWNSMMHDYSKQLKDQYISSNGQFKRYECIYIMDLKHLSTSQLSKRVLKLIKESSAIDSLCFPETLNHMAIVNAPSFFAFTWKLIKSWVDPRTANKVSVLSSNKEKIVRHLTKFIDRDVLSSDFGGNGKSIDDVLKKEIQNQYNAEFPDSDLNLENSDTHMMSLHKQSSHKVNVPDGNIIKLSLFCRSLRGGNVIIKDVNGCPLPQIPQSGIEIIHRGKSEEDENELPTRYDLDETHGIILQGSKHYTIEVTPLSRKHTGRDILLAMKEYSNKQTMIHPNTNVSSIQTDAVLGCVHSQSIFTGTYSFDTAITDQ